VVLLLSHPSSKVPGKTVFFNGCSSFLISPEGILSHADEIEISSQKRLKPEGELSRE